MRGQVARASRPCHKKPISSSAALYGQRETNAALLLMSVEYDRRVRRTARPRASRPCHTAPHPAIFSEYDSTELVELRGEGSLGSGWLARSNITWPVSDAEACQPCGA